MPSNSGVSYERLGQEIFREILGQSHVPIDVRHNVTLQGKTTTHQIDLYWEFKIGGICYTTVVQAKDWATPVGQGELLKFRAVLDDLPGQPRGIVVTKNGYQRGAEEYAHAHGIVLYELAENPAPERPAPPIVVTVEDYMSMAVVGLAYPDSPKSLAGIRVNFTISTPRYSNLRLQVDKAWRQAMEARHGPNALREAMPAPTTRTPRNIVFYDEIGSPRTTLYDLCAETVHEMTRKGELRREIKIPFDAPTFFPVSSSPIPFVKVELFSATLEIAVVVKGGLPDFVELVLTSLSDGTVRRFRRPRTGTPTN